MNEESIFAKAVEIDSPRDRADYLEEACGGDPELRRQVEELLAAHEGPGSFLGRPAAEIAGTIAMPANIDEGPGTEIGRYKLLEQIGEGGMGVVYMAEQREPVRRRVALKIIKPGMDSQQVIARFEAERQALALMEHQNIARVLDAATTETGRPYFVMELVRGVPITDYCDKNNLTPRERLGLFIPVCQAIQHAHLKGIIHRDIKPSNVLVCLYDGKPVPKVIDFGIAKAVRQQLTEKTMFTQHGQVIGTLEYMSPEQAEMSQLDIDTRSDVYSLGVLLYELLTGTTPITKQQLLEAGFVEMLRMIREEDPDRPSTRISQSGDALPSISAQRKVEPRKLSLLMRGELDWIVMKALEKDRTRRYESASALGADVERYLGDEPVQACPPSAGYKFRKFAHKHRTALGIAASFLLLVLGATCVSAWLAIRATQAEGLAESRLESERLALEETRSAQRKESRAREQAEADRDRALAAEEQAKDTLARGLFEQARAVRLAGRNGHYWQALELLEQAESLRGRERWTSQRAVPSELPARGELRTQALATLLVPDGRVTRTWAGLYQSVDPHGRFAGLMEMKTTGTTYPTLGLRIVDLTSGEEFAKLDLGSAAESLGTAEFAVSPRAERIATAHAEEVRLTDVRTGRKVASLTWPVADPEREPRGRVSRILGWIEFSPDGNHVAAFRVAVGIGEIVLWELPDNVGATSDDERIAPILGRQLGTTREAALFSPNFSRDSRRLAYPSEQGIAVWNIEREELEAEFEVQAAQRPFGPLGFADDGRSVAAICVSKKQEESSLVVWDRESGDRSHVIATGRTAWIAPPRFSPDGSRVVTGTMQGEIAIFNLQVNSEELRLDHGAAVRRVGWFDDRRIWSTGAGAMKEWQLSPTRPVRMFRADSPREFRSLSFSFSRDGRWMATRSDSRKLRVFRWPDGKPHRTLDVPARTMLDINLGPRGRRAVVTGIADATGSFAELGKLGLLPTTATAFDLETGEQRFQEEGRGYTAVGVTDEGHIRLLASQGPKLSVHERGRDEPIWKSSGKVPPGSQPAATISPNGRRLATWVFSFEKGSRDRSLEIWDLDQGTRMLDVADVGDRVAGGHFSAGGELLVTVHMDPFAKIGQMADVSATARVWNATSGQKLLEVTGPQVMATAFGRDGRLLALQFHGRRVEVWNTETGEHLFTWALPGRQSSLIQAAALQFTPDGKSLGAVVDSSGHIEFLDLEGVRGSLEEIDLGW